MAIKRCPYCRAIIDEKDEYCKNCGTQLLFPEDESVEEDIPGDRIVDEDESGAEPEKRRGGGEGIAADEEAEETEEDEEEIESRVLLEAETLAGAGKEPAGEQSQSLAEAAHPPSSETPDEEATRKTEDLTFKTKELDRFMPTAELGKDQFEKFLASFDEGERDERRPNAPEELPPWAEQMKKPRQEQEPETERSADVQASESGEDWTAAPGGETEEVRPTSPSGIGIPEKLTQRALPFGAEEEREMSETEEKFLDRDESVINDEDESSRFLEPPSWREQAVRPPSRFKALLKAKVFDLFFIAVVWGFAVWLAARSMEVSLVRLVGAAALSVGLFYLVLLASYWSLFYIFLGETLGDRIFALSEE